jgi:hypothetical protein
MVDTLGLRYVYGVPPHPLFIFFWMVDTLGLRYVYGVPPHPLFIFFWMVDTLGLRYKKGVWGFTPRGCGGLPPFEENKIDGDFLFEKISITNSKTMNNTLNETNFNETKFNMQSPAINPGGLVKGLLDGKGFTLHACMSELEDNKQGAKATKSIYLLNPKTNEVASKDNGLGMDKEVLYNSHVFYNRGEENHDETNQSKFGVGSKAANINLTKGLSTVTLSKKKDGELNQLNADWQKAIEQQQYFPQAHEATKKCDEFWQNNAIDKEQGTIVINKCPSTVFDELVESIRDTSSKGILAVFGRMYANQLQAGYQIEFRFTDSDEVFTVKPIDVLNYEETPVHMKKEHELLYYCLPENKKNGIAIFKNTEGEELMIKKSIKKNGTEKKELILGKKPENYELLSSLKLRTVVAFDPVTNVEGGMYLSRKNKIVGTYKQDLENIDCTRKITIGRCSRSVILCDSKMDEAVAVEENKSKIDFEKMSSSLKEMCEFLHNEFCKRVHDTYHHSAKAKKAAKKVKKDQKNADKVNQEANKVKQAAEKKAQQEADKLKQAAEKKAKEEAEKAEAKRLKELKKKHPHEVLSKETLRDWYSNYSIEEVHAKLQTWMSA